MDMNVCWFIFLCIIDSSKLSSEFEQSFLGKENTLPWSSSLQRDQVLWLHSIFSLHRILPQSLTKVEVTTSHCVFAVAKFSFFFFLLFFPVCVNLTLVLLILTRIIFSPYSWVLLGALLTSYAVAAPMLLLLCLLLFHWPTVMPAERGPNTIYLMPAAECESFWRC